MQDSRINDLIHEASDLINPCVTGLHKIAERLHDEGLGQDATRIINLASKIDKAHHGLVDDFMDAYEL
jgi:hypothetical protein